MASVAHEHIEKHTGEPARLARLPRIRVAQIVMDYLAHGWSPDEMCRHYPHLTPAEAHAAMMLKAPGMEHDEPYMAHVPPGRRGEIVWRFNRAGQFEFACLIAGHYQAGMVGAIHVRA